MKRLRSYGDDLGSTGDKDLERTSSPLSSSSHHRRLYSKPSENARSRSFIDEDRDRPGSRKRVDYDFGDGFDDRDGAGGSRSFRKRGIAGDYDHADGFDDREVGGASRGLKKKVADHDLLDGYDGREREGSLRGSRKRLEHDGDGAFDRRKVVLDRFRDRDWGSVSSLVSPRGGYAGERMRERERDRDRDRDRERIHRSESFCVSRKEFPKGFRSERDRMKREDSVSSWRRFGSRSKKDGDDEVKSSVGERGAASGKAGVDAACSRESLRSPHRLRDVRSPSWSRDSKKSPTWSRDSKKSPTWSLDSKKSPTWSKDSKDSGVETSKVVVKKNVSVVVESGPVSASGSEMEEGELQPEANQEQPVPKSVSEHAAADDNKAQADSTEEKDNEPESSQHMKTSVSKSADENPCHKEVVEAVKSDSKEQSNAAEGVKVVSVMEHKPAGCQSNLQNKVYGNGNRDIMVSNDDSIGANSTETVKETDPVSSDTANGKIDDHVIEDKEGSPMNPLSSNSAAEKEKTLGNIDLEAPADDLNEPVPIKFVMEETEKEPEFSTAVLKDKGKGVAISSPDDANFAGNGFLIERNFISCRDDSMEGPSTRGLELFATSVGTKAERVDQSSRVKGDNDQLKLEPLDLSLGLQMTSLPAASNDVDPPPPQSPPRARSVQSFGTTFRTGSENFTTSMSFSGSQFMHNPSCSLTRNSIDYDFEQSVKSRPLFQGIDWQTQSMNDNKQNEVPVPQKILPNGNGSLHLAHASQGMLNGHHVQGQQGTPLGLTRSGSFHRNLSAMKAYENDVRSPTQSAGSHDTRSEFSKDKRRGPWEECSRLIRSSSQREMPQVLAQDSDIVDRIIALVASQPIQTMAWKVQEMAEQEVACLKDSTCAMILREDKHEKLCMLQEVLKNRADLTLEGLLKSHRVQLEILVALRTGLTDFLQRGDNVPSTDLAEIFLNFKCRNLNCRSLLPVDECDCRFCSRKEGFCSTCMCLICSKFDTASNTCGWVGCDVCSHWCHTDCGLQKSFIRNGHSATSSQGTSEMQFYCVACDHPSEMYGFVKDVFKTCASEWKADIMRKELEFVKRIFGASNDARGKFLHDFANLLLGRLQTGVTVKEVYLQMIGFLNEGESKFANAVVSSGKEPQALQKNKDDGSNGVTPLGQEAAWLNSVSLKDHPKLESSGFTLPNNEGTSIRGTWDSDLPTATKKQAPVPDELESIVKIKLAEAQMFQTRADDARREADRLKRIAVSKNEKIDEEYKARISKLRLPEAEERRRQKLEELQILEKSHREYYNMKLRMEADIKNLLLKMEDTERNLNA